MMNPINPLITSTLLKERELEDARREAYLARRDASKNVKKTSEPERKSLIQSLFGRLRPEPPCESC